MLKSVGTSAFPLAGTLASVALKSQKSRINFISIIRRKCDLVCETLPREIVTSRESRSPRRQNGVFRQLFNPEKRGWSFTVLLKLGDFGCWLFNFRPIVLNLCSGHRVEWINETAIKAGRFGEIDS